MIDEVVVNRWLMKAAEKYGVKFFDRGTIAVTEAVFPCLRKAYYDRTRRRVPTPIEAIKTLGSEVHALLQEAMRSEGYVTEVGVGLELKDFKLVGRVDAVKYDDEGNAVEAVEIKSSNGLKNHALESHRLQLQTYLALLKAKKGYLIYIDRGSGRVRVFEIKPNTKALTKVILRAKQLYEALSNHEEPPPNQGPWCRLCPHYWHCIGRWKKLSLIHI